MGRNWLVSPCRDLISFTLVFNIHVDTLKGSEGKFKDRFYKYQKYLVRYILVRPISRKLRRKKMKKDLQCKILG